MSAFNPATLRFPTLKLKMNAPSGSPVVAPWGAENRGPPTAFRGTDRAKIDRVKIPDIAAMRRQFRENGRAGTPASPATSQAKP